MHVVTCPFSEHQMMLVQQVVVVNVMLVCIIDKQRG